MNVAAITIRKENSRAANVKIKKNLIEVEDLYAENPSNANDSVYNSFSPKEDNHSLIGLLSHITKQKTKNITAVFSIPGSLIGIRYAENTVTRKEEWNATKKKWISDLFKITDTDQYIFETIEIPRKGGGRHVTAFSIPQLYVDTILKTSKILCTDIKKLSIEPESIAALRFINDWENTCCLLEVESDNAILTTYEPNKGMFSMLLPEAGWNNLLNPENGLEVISNVLAMHEITVNNAFGYSYKDGNFQPPIYLLSEYSSKLYELLSKSQYADRFKSFEVPQFIQSKDFNTNELIQYSSTLGLAQRHLFEKEVKGKNESIHVYKLRAERSNQRT